MHWALVLVALATGGGPGVAGAAGTASAGDPRARPPPCPAALATRCKLHYFGLNEYTYVVDGLMTKIEYTDGGYFTLDCPKNLMLNSSALPRFESQLRVNKVQLRNCPPPQGSYAAVLRAFNVLVLDKLQLIGRGLITPAHFVGFEQLLTLELFNAELAPGTLRPLTQLLHLQLNDVRLPAGELLALPTSLQSLALVRSGAPPSAALERLPALQRLTVRDNVAAEVRAPAGLRDLVLEMPGAHVPAALPAALRRLALSHWGARHPAPWSTCAALETLQAQHAAAEALPPAWLRRCSRLRDLRLERARALRELAPDSLAGAAVLENLTLTHSALTTLPPGLLDDARRLRLLDLSGNRLQALPSGLFANTVSLQSLDLSKNRLTTSVFTALTAVTSLTTLKLSNNVDLKDSCDNMSGLLRSPSSLQYLKKLNKLYLRNTGATVICSDWRLSMPSLDTLDLANNNITVLSYQDVQFRGAVDVTVYLGGNNVSSLLYTREDYESAMESGVATRAVLNVTSALRCDCDAYWAALVLRTRPHAGLGAVRCAGAGALSNSLSDAPPDEMLCAAPDLCARAPRCSCWYRDHRHDARPDARPDAQPATRPNAQPDARPDARPYTRLDARPDTPRRLLRLRCERAGLTRLADVVALAGPAAARDSYAWQLYLAHNRIDSLHVSDLPTHLLTLDLSYNNLSAVEADAARALLSDASRSVWLGHNPLHCECGAALLAGRAALRDYGNLTCHGGSSLAAALQACVSPFPLPVVVGAALAPALLGGALALLLAHPRVRLRLKAALHRRGWLPAAAESPDECRFDAFVSFSHGDEAAACELVARLEAGGYRVCVHYRDWAPGGWIPAQIAASVRQARRTVALVSPHFLRSAWACAELRAALALAMRDARPRLVLVLLEEPRRLALDRRLRSYIAANTYLRWGDPCFWEKLYLALPRGGARPAPARAPLPRSPAQAPVTPAQAPVIPAQASVTPAPTPVTLAPTTASPSVTTAMDPGFPTPTAVVPRLPTPTAMGPGLPTLTAVSPELPTPTAVSPELPTPTAVGPGLPTPTAVGPGLPVPDAQAPATDPVPTELVSSPAIELDIPAKPSCLLQYSSEVGSYGTRCATDVTACGA